MQITNAHKSMAQDIFSSLTGILSTALESDLRRQPKLRISGLEEFSEEWCRNEIKKPDLKLDVESEKLRQFNLEQKAASDYFKCHGLWLSNTDTVLIPERALIRNDTILPYQLMIRNLSHELTHAFQTTYFNTHASPVFFDSRGSYILDCMIEGHADYIPGLLISGSIVPSINFFSKKSINQIVTDTLEVGMPFLEECVSKESEGKVVIPPSKGLLYFLGYAFMKSKHESGMAVKDLIKNIISPPLTYKELVETATQIIF